MNTSQFLRARFWLVPLPLLATAAFCNARAVSELVGATLTLDERDLVRPPNVVSAAVTPPSSAPRGAGADTILKRNAFDHVAGPLVGSPDAEVGTDAEHAPLSLDDPWSAPACEGVNVKAIAASSDQDWSFVSILGADNKPHLLRRGGDVGGKTIAFIGWDRIWLTSATALCQASLFREKVEKPAPAPPAPPPASSAPRRGAQPLAADLKQGIQPVSPTEWNIDRGVLDKILENQAELMRQARIVPVQENGRVVGVRLNGVKPDALLGVLGMQNGDTLKTINGYEMGSPERALEAYARLRTSDKLTISIARGGKNMNLDYNIK